LELGEFVFLATGLSPRSDKRDLMPKRARRKAKAQRPAQGNAIISPRC
jgi:hypothetical protein